MRSLSIAATGMQAQEMNVETISNNIANMATTGFKQQRVEFQDLLYQNLRRVGSPSADNGDLVPSGIQKGLGVRTAATYRMFSQGNLVVTDNQYDVALQGKGFFQINLPSGEIGFTRAGSFQLSAEGALVTNDGYAVEPAITVPEDALDVTINRNGEVLVSLPGQVDPANVGQIQLARFRNENGLVALGQNLFLQTPASGPPIVGNAGQQGFAGVLQGFLESSNVDSVSEITDLIRAQRAYEMNSKVIQTSDEMLQTASNLR